MILRLNLVILLISLKNTSGFEERTLFPVFAGITDNEKQLA
jgi:hypothetical protein